MLEMETSLSNYNNYVYFTILEKEHMFFFF